MAKKQPQPAPEPTADQSAKIAGDVLRMARIIVAARGGTVSKLLSDICRPELNRIMREMRTRGELDPAED